MKIDPPISMTILAAAFLLAACGDSEKSSVGVTSAVTPLPQIAAVLAETAPSGAVSVVEARRNAEPGARVTVEGIVAGTRFPFTEGFASIILGDLAMETCDKISGDECPTPWDACCADPDVLKGQRLTLQISDAEGRPVAQSLKGIEGLAEMNQITAEGTVAPSSTPENLVINVSRLHRTPAK